MYGKEIENKINRVLKNIVEKQILLDGKKYTSVVSEKTIKDLYDRIYELLKKHFDAEIIKEKLKIEKDYTNCETLSINLYRNSNELYKFIPIEDGNKKILYYKLILIGAYEENLILMLEDDGNMFYNMEKVLETFINNEICELKEGRYLEIKEDCIEKKLYIKARDHYRMHLIGSEEYCKRDLMKCTYEENNLIAANMYINQLLNYDIEDKDFLTEIYNLKFKIDYSNGKDRNYEYLKKAINLDTINQNVLVTALRQMIKEIENGKKGKLIFLLDYLVENIKNIEVNKASIIYIYLNCELLDESVLYNCMNKKISEMQLKKVIFIYETILEKMKATKVMGHAKNQIYKVEKFIEVLNQIKNKK